MSGCEKTFLTKKPHWLRAKASLGPAYYETLRLARTFDLCTVCEEAACPNMGECFAKKQATFIVLGKICTRRCKFCNISKGKPLPPDPTEPKRLAKMTQALQLKHVVVTSVTRDDLPDGGAEHFVKVIKALKIESPDTTIEILTPDFLYKDGAHEKLAIAMPEVFNHNLEMIPRLYKAIRPGACYSHSLNLLRQIKILNPKIFTKSGLMVGLGETISELQQVMKDLRKADVDFLTIGQYLQPTSAHYPLQKYYTPEEFKQLKAMASTEGFLMVSASPLTRSSYHAGSDFEKLRARISQSCYF